MEINFEALYYGENQLFSMDNLVATNGKLQTVPLVSSVRRDMNVILNYYLLLSVLVNKHFSVLAFLHFKYSFFLSTGYEDGAVTECVGRYTALYTGSLSAMNKNLKVKVSR
jgi:hypothetical protein